MRTFPVSPGLTSPLRPLPGRSACGLLPQSHRCLLFHLIAFSSLVLPAPPGLGPVGLHAFRGLGAFMAVSSHSSSSLSPWRHLLRVEKLPFPARPFLPTPPLLCPLKVSVCGSVQPMRVTPSRAGTMSSSASAPKPATAANTQGSVYWS